MDYATEEEQDLYRIGTIAKLTGLSVERLRAWERRYELIPAHREGRTRFYSKAQLERLLKIKKLIDQGHPISSIVDLTDENLDARLASRTAAPTTTAKIGLIGPNLQVLEQQQADLARVDVRARWANMDAFADGDMAGIGDLDVVVAQITVLSPHAVNYITKQVSNARVVAVYHYATQAQIEAVQAAGTPVLQWPTTWLDIEQACAISSGRPLRAARSAPPRYTDEELIAIAASASDPFAVPRHLVELITQLNALSEFVLDCADQGMERSDDEAGALYEQVHHEASQARAQLELALDPFIQADQLLDTPN